jgi:hypothetical protein
MIITAAIIILGVYDLFVAFWGGLDSSISRAMQDAGFKSPTIPFVLGYICGHWFGYMKPNCPKCPNCKKID